MSDVTIQVDDVTVEVFVNHDLLGGGTVDGPIIMGQNPITADTNQTAARPSRWLHLFADGANRAVGWLRNGFVAATGLLVPFAGTAQRPRRFVAGWRDDRRAVIAIERSGRTTLRHSPTGLGVLGDDFAGTTWRGSDRVLNLRPGVRFARATMQDADKTVYDVRQQRGGYRLPTAVADGAGIDLVIGLGQSNRGHGSGNAGPPPFNQTPYPRHVLAFANISNFSFVDFYGNILAESTAAGLATNLVPLFQFIDLAPARHPQNYALSPTTMTATAMEALARQNGNPGPPKITFANWRGSTAANDFEPGDIYFLYENVIESCRRAKQVAAAYGFTVPKAHLFFTQGEAGPTSGYATVLGSLIDSYKAGIQAAIGSASAPHFYFNQINQSQTVSESATGVELDQRQVAINRLGAGVTCVGPMYQFRLFDQGAVNIHIDNLGRMMMGELEALVARLVEAGTTFSPVGLSVAAVRTGAQIDVNFSNLPGLATLIADGDWVPTVPNLGFVAALASDGSALTINSAVILDADTVRITLSANPGAAVRLDYARDNSNAQTLWARGRGLLYVNSGVASPIAAANGGPATIRHYCLRFRITTAS